MVVFNTSNSIADERVKLFVNGNRVSSFSTNTIFAQNSATYFNNSTYSARLAKSYTTDYFDGYTTEVNFVDGQALNPSYFGQFSSVSGQWIPINYTGTYGTNGFYLDFKDQSSVTALGYDKSGNNNNWTPANISLTAGVTYDSMLDSPTNNYAVLNAIEGQNNGGTISEASLKITNSQWLRARSTLGVRSGKWYWEVNYTTFNQCIQGVVDDTFVFNNNSIGAGGGWGAAYGANTGSIWVNGVNVSGNGFLPTCAIGDIIGYALDMDAGQLDVYKNGTFIGTIITGLTAHGTIYPAFSVANGAVIYVNFGQRPFSQTPPSGYKKLNTSSLSTPSITRGETGFDVATYTGNGGNIQVGEYQFPRPNYTIAKSLRFKSATNSYLSRAFGVSPADTSQNIQTYSVWFKRTSLAAQQSIFIHSLDANSYGGIAFDSSDRLWLYVLNTSTVVVNKVSTNVFRDSNWHHLFVAVDTTNIIAEDRIKVYVDNNRITSWTTNVNPAQNTPYLGNIAPTSGTWTFTIGSTILNTLSKFDGYLAEFYTVDGQALSTSDFGESDINGYWIPKAYTGTYGTNGFYLPFSDNSALTTSSNDGLGKDFSSNSLYFATSNISITAGSTYDSMTDSPTNSTAVLDMLDYAYGTLGTGNIGSGGLQATTGTASANGLWVKSTIAIPTYGKWYWEVKIDNLVSTFDPGTRYRIGVSDGYITELDVSLAVNDIIGVAFDTATDTSSFYKNGVSLGITKKTSRAAYDRINASSIMVGYNGTSYSQQTFNFGQCSFTYTPPTGFNMLSIPNIAEYTSDLESPDLVWIKSRSAVTSHAIFDSGRGASRYLNSDGALIEVTDVNSLVSFNKNGFYLGNAAIVNTLNNTYVAWMWKKNPALGFDVVTGSRTTGTQTIAHSLGVKPSFIIGKPLNSNNPWPTTHKSYGANMKDYNANLNSTAVPVNIVDTWGAEPTSTDFYINNNQIPASGTYVFYLFAEIAGYSKFGSYVGNAAADGTFVYCGFKPRFILIKCISTTGSWGLYDEERETYNDGATSGIIAEGAGAETTTSAIDFLSNGFKLRSATVQNAAQTYVYAAFAESPFKYATAK